MESLRAGAGVVSSFDFFFFNSLFLVVLGVLEPFRDFSGVFGYFETCLDGTRFSISRHLRYCGLG